jgi:hypothetical protein
MVVSALGSCLTHTCIVLFQIAILDNFEFAFEIISRNCNNHQVETTGTSASSHEHTHTKPRSSAEQMSHTFSSDDATGRTISMYVPTLDAHGQPSRQLHTFDIVDLIIGMTLARERGEEPMNPVTQTPWTPAQQQRIEQFPLSPSARRDIDAYFRERDLIREAMQRQRRRHALNPTRSVNIHNAIARHQQYQQQQQQQQVPPPRIRLQSRLAPPSMSM